MPSYSLFAFTNAVPGREEEFNDWYTNTHLADVLRLPGVCAAQRFRLGDLQHKSGPHPWDYMAVYEIETDDLNVTLEKLRDVSGTSEMPLSPGLQEQRMVWIYQPITGRVER